MLRAMQVCDRHMTVTGMQCSVHRVTQRLTAMHMCAEASGTHKSKPTRVQGARQQAECEGRPYAFSSTLHSNTLLQAPLHACGCARETAAGCMEGPHLGPCCPSASQPPVPGAAVIFLVVVQRPFVPWAVQGDGVCGLTTHPCQPWHAPAYAAAATPHLYHHVHHVSQGRAAAHWSVAFAHRSAVRMEPIGFGVGGRGCQESVSCQ